jgi:hypothetical protein
MEWGRRLLWACRRGCSWLDLGQAARLRALLPTLLPQHLIHTPFTPPSTYPIYSPSYIPHLLPTMPTARDGALTAVANAAALRFWTSLPDFAAAVPHPPCPFSHNADHIPPSTAAPSPPILQEPPALASGRRRRGCRVDSSSRLARGQQQQQSLLSMLCLPSLVSPNSNAFGQQHRGHVVATGVPIVTRLQDAFMPQVQVSISTPSCPRQRKCAPAASAVQQTAPLASTTSLLSIPAATALSSLAALLLQLAAPPQLP